MGQGRENRGDHGGLGMNAFKKRLLQREVQYGLFSVLLSVEVADALTDSGFDYLIFDTEHTPSSLPALHGKVLALTGTTTHAIVRVPTYDPNLFKPILDLGVDTLMVPNIKTAEEAMAAVQGVRFPPHGIRGIGGSVRATRYGRHADYYAQADAQICLLVQIESREGLDNIEKICAVDGIDGVFFGPADLAADMGQLGRPGHADVIRACMDGVRRVRASGKAAGVVTSEAHVHDYLDAGASMVCLGSDVALLAKTFDALAARWRGVNKTHER